MNTKSDIEIQREKFIWIDLNDYRVGLANIDARRERERALELLVADTRANREAFAELNESIGESDGDE